ncbi:unnamed protein product [Schistosoma turkestanicum]|nr:unnamed protein product [Schistosoma turkestanicum]
MHHSKVNGYEYYNKMPTQFTVHNRNTVKGPSTDVAPLEHLFVTKFSRLTIDDEYKYNLAYLVTENDGTAPAEKHRSAVQNPKPFDRIHVNSIHRKSEPVIPINSGAFYRSASGTRQKPLRSKVSFRRSSPVYVSSPESYEHMSSDFDDQGDYDYSPFSKRFTKVNDSIELNQGRYFQQKKPLIPVNNSVDTPSAKLDCSSPICTSNPKINTPLCKVEESLKHAKPKLRPNNIMLRRDISQTLDKQLRHANESRLESMKIKVNAPDPLMRDNFCSHDVASRVQAFKALMKSEELESTDQNSETKVIEKVANERKISDVSYQGNHVGFRRSKTFSGEQMSRRYQQYMDLCFDCGKRIYPVDRISTGERVYHKACFRCATCQRTLL